MAIHRWLALGLAISAIAMRPLTLQAFEFTELGDTMGPIENFLNPALAPDGSEFVYNARESDTQTIRFFDLEERTVSEAFDIGITPSSISFDGSDVILSVGVSAIYLHRGGSTTLLVDQTMEEPDPVNPLNTTFGGVLPGRRAVSDGRVVFHTINGTKSAIWIANGVTLDRLWSQYDVWCPASECGSKQTLRRIVDTSISGSRVAFASEAGVFISDIDGESCAMLLENDIKDMSGCAIVVDTDFPDFTTREWDTVILDGLDLVFRVVGEGVYFSSGGGTPQPVVELGVTLIPGSAEPFSEVDAFFLEGGNVIFEGVGTFQCPEGGAPFVGGGVFLWSRAGIETVLAPCDLVGDEFVSFALLQRNLPLSAESVSAQRIVVEAQVAPDLTLGPVRTATFLAEGTPVVESFDSYPIQSDVVGVEDTASGENVKVVVDETETPVAFSDAKELTIAEISASADRARRLEVKGERGELNLGPIAMTSWGRTYTFFRTILEVVEVELVDFPENEAFAPTSRVVASAAAPPIQPVGGPFGRYFATPQDVRGRVIRARVNRRPGDLRTEMRFFLFRDEGREGAVSRAFELTEAPKEFEVAVNDFTTLTLPEEPFVPFDPESVEGIGLAFWSADGPPGTEVVVQVEQVALVPEPSVNLSGVVALSILIACARARRGHGKAG